MSLLLTHLASAGWMADLLKLVIAGSFGFLIGLERESRERAAGVRTYMLIALGSCAMMILARYLSDDLFASSDAGSSLRIDPGRIPSYAIASMGFMGAGVIYKGRGVIRGITTAAGMWVMTVIGLSTGAGYYGLALMVTLLSFFTLLFLRRFTKSWFYKNDTALTIVAEDKPGILGAIKNIVQKYSQAKIEDVKYEKRIDGDKNFFMFQFCFPAKKQIHWEDVDRELESLGGIKKITVEENNLMFPQSEN